MAHTLPYDFAVLAGTQTGRPLPSERWVSTQSSTLVMVGSKSEPFFHCGAKALSNILPRAQYRALEGRDHSAVQMAPNAIAAAVEEFFLANR